MDETGYWLNLEKNHDELIDYAREIEDENEILKAKLEKIKEYIGICCHRFSQNNKNLCYGCEFDREVCDYSIILNIIEGAEDE